MIFLSQPPVLRSLRFAPLLVGLLILGATVRQQRAVLLLEEKFEDDNLKKRGWYDLADGALASFTEKQHAPGSARSVAVKFQKGGTTPVPRVAFRHLFPETDRVYFSFWVKYSQNWIGSAKQYQPHEFQLLTNVDSEYVGPSRTHLTVYIEHNFRDGGYGVLGIQDGENIDESLIGADLRTVSENRAVAGCNGSPRGERGDCYEVDGKHNNGRFWRTPGPVFRDGIGQGTKNDWHKIEAYFQLNTVSGPRALYDGIARYWFDGKLIMDRQNVLFRTALFRGMKFRQLIFDPYIGDGSPQDQTAWFDDLVVMTGHP